MGQEVLQDVVSIGRQEGSRGCPSRHDAGPLRSPRSPRQTRLTSQRLRAASSAAMPRASIVEIHGTWAWTTHRSDCNTNRAGVGFAIDWGDNNGNHVTNARRRLDRRRRGDRHPAQRAGQPGSPRRAPQHDQRHLGAGELEEHVRQVQRKLQRGHLGHGHVGPRRWLPLPAPHLPGQPDRPADDLRADL